MLLRYFILSLASVSFVQKEDCSFFGQKKLNRFLRQIGISLRFANHRFAIHSCYYVLSFSER